MNRIRIINKDKIQVLTTPLAHRFDAGFEYLINSWTESHLRTYRIKEFDNMEDALTESYNYPDINWGKLVLFHKDSFVRMNLIIKNILDRTKLVVEYEPTIMSPTQVKSTMFNRILNNGISFNLSWLMNHVYGYHISNPYSTNLRELMTALIDEPQLRINKVYKHSSGAIRLVGTTDFGTSYEICLWPTLLSNWAKWMLRNPDLSIESLTKSLDDVIVAQKQVDQSFVR